jgi:hypothetical protein
MDFLGRLIKFVFLNLISAAVIMYIGIGFMTGEFPPKIGTIRDYVKNLASLKDNYQMMVGQSARYAEAMKIADTDPGIVGLPTGGAAPEQTKLAESTATLANSMPESTIDPNAPDSQQIASLRSEVEMLRLRLQALELQNKAILSRIK